MNEDQRRQLLVHVAEAQNDMLARIARGESWNTMAYWQAVHHFQALTAAAQE